MEEDSYGGSGKNPSNQEEMSRGRSGGRGFPCSPWRKKASGATRQFPQPVNSEGKQRTVFFLSSADRCRDASQLGGKETEKAASEEAREEDELLGKTGFLSPCRDAGKQKRKKVRSTRSPSMMS